MLDEYHLDQPFLESVDDNLIFDFKTGFIFNSMYMCMGKCLCVQKPEEGRGPLGARVRSNYELNRVRKPNSLLQEQHVL